MELARPMRVKRKYVQSLVAPAEQVFPLLCPVRETEWVSGWDPRLVISESGYVEPDCIFVMPEQPHDAIWIVTQWHPAEFFVEFIKVTPDFTVGKIEIKLKQADRDQSLAEISYSFTALSEAGARFVEAFTQEYYEAFMQEWESELNHFLQTGRKKAEIRHRHHPGA